MLRRRFLTRCVGPLALLMGSVPAASTTAAAHTVRPAAVAAPLVAGGQRGPSSMLRDLHRDVWPSMRLHQAATPLSAGVACGVTVRHCSTATPGSGAPLSAALGRATAAEGDAAEDLRRLKKRRDALEQQRDALEKQKIRKIQREGALDDIVTAAMARRNSLGPGTELDLAERNLEQAKADLREAKAGLASFERDFESKIGEVKSEITDVESKIADLRAPPKALAPCSSAEDVLEVLRGFHERDGIRKKHEALVWPEMDGAVESWGKDLWKANLRDAWDDIKPNLLASRSAQHRQKLTAGFFAPTGDGKTHRLFEVQECFGAPIGLYVTYNGRQQLSFDRTNMVRALLIRLILRMLDAEAGDSLTTTRCGDALYHHRDELESRFPSHKLLMDAFVQLVKQRLNPSGKDQPVDFTTPAVCICVDEVLCVDKDSVPPLLSAQRRVAAALALRGIPCFCICSSLKAEVVKSTSAGPLYPVEFPRGNAEMRDALIASARKSTKLADKITDEKVLMIKAAGGYHARSIVLGLEMAGSLLTVEQLRSVLQKNLRSPTSIPGEESLRKYVVDTLRDGPHDLIKPNEAEPYVAEDNMVAPIFLMHVFGAAATKKDASAETKRAFKLIDAMFVVSTLGTPSKRFEKWCAALDRLRGVLNVNPLECASFVDKSCTPELEQQLRRCRLSKEACLTKPLTNSLFQTNASHKPTSSDAVVLSSTSVTQYWVPELQNHYDVDRFYALVHPDSTTTARAWVLVQDKLGHTAEFKDAVDKLNHVADQVKAKTRKPVVCVLVAPQWGCAKQWARGQTFPHPLVIISTKEDVKRHFTPMLKPALDLLVEQHRG